jgi:hypothetical protein
VDAVLRELGRAEAGLASKTREPVQPSPQFILQYFTSFSEDPVIKEIEKVRATIGLFCYLKRLYPTHFS